MSEKWEGALICFIGFVGFIFVWDVAASARENSVAEMCDTFRSFVINDVRYTCERVVP